MSNSIVAGSEFERRGGPYGRHGYILRSLSIWKGNTSHCHGLNWGCFLFSHLLVEWWKPKHKQLKLHENCLLILKIREQEFSLQIVLFFNSLVLKQVSFFLWEPVGLTRQWWCQSCCFLCPLEYDFWQAMVLVLAQLLLCKMKMIAISRLVNYMSYIQFNFACHALYGLNCLLTS